MSVPTIDLSTLNPQVEVILRAGDIRQPNAREVLQRNYAAGNPDYPTVLGVSVLFAPGADVPLLVQRNIVPHKRVAHGTIQHILIELTTQGYDMVLYVTPDLPRLPDHHQLAVIKQGVVLVTLPDDAADALLKALHDDSNPNPRR
jgi:Mrp family chromosome partitioning ATPase